MRAAATFLLCIIGCFLAIQIAAAQVLTEAEVAAHTAAVIPPEFHIFAQENAIFVVYLIFSAWGSSASAGLRKHGNTNGGILLDFFAGWGLGFCISGLICEYLAQRWLGGISLMSVSIAVSGIAGAGIIPLLYKLNEKDAFSKIADWILHKGDKK